MNTKTDYEVIIIGGSFAGLSAAMALGRSLRKTLIIDSGKPCNQPTPNSHNFITHDGEKPAVIANKAKEQVLQYTSVTFINAQAVSGKKMSDYFAITTNTRQTFSTQKLIFATGIKDVLPNIKGFASCWGKSVIHCPYCHGYEFKGQKTALMASGDKAMHMAGLLRNLTDELIIIDPKNSFTKEQLYKLSSKGIQISTASIAEIIHQNGYVSNIHLATGETLPLKALYAPVPFKQHCDIPELLGCTINEQGYIATDTFNKTTIPGVYACGDNSHPMRSVANAVAQGNLTGAMVNMELVQDHF